MVNSKLNFRQNIYESPHEAYEDHLIEQQLQRVVSESDSDSNQFLVRNGLRRPSIYNQAGRLIDEVVIESARII